MKKKMLHRLLALAMAIVMVLGMLPELHLHAHAEGEGGEQAVTLPTTLYVGGVAVITDGAVVGDTSGTGWSYDTDTATLNLTDGADIRYTSSSENYVKYGIYCDGTLNIYASGNVSVTGASHGIYLPTGNLNLCAAEGAAVTIKGIRTRGYGIATEDTGVVTLSGKGTVSATSAQVDYATYGIYAGEVRIDGITLNAEGNSNYCDIKAKTSILVGQTEAAVVNCLGSTTTGMNTDEGKIGIYNGSTVQLTEKNRPDKGWLLGLSANSIEISDSCVMMDGLTGQSPVYAFAGKTEVSGNSHIRIGNIALTNSGQYGLEGETRFTAAKDYYCRTASDGEFALNADIVKNVSYFRLYTSSHHSYHSNGDGTHYFGCPAGCHAAIRGEREPCTESGYSDNGDNHSFTCTVCQTEVTEDHTFDATGTCKCGALAEAKIGETFYATLAQAAGNAAEGDTIHVLTDVDTDADIAFAAFVKLDVAEGKTVNCTGNVTIGEDAGIIFENALYYDGGDANKDWTHTSAIAFATYYTAGDGYVILLPATAEVETILILHNATFCASMHGDGNFGMVFSAPLNIRFSGNNTLSVIDHQKSGVLYATENTILTGLGENPVLTIQGGSAEYFSIIGAEIDGDLTINSGTVNISSGDGGDNCVGVSVVGKLTVVSGAVLNVAGGESPYNVSIGATTGQIEENGTINGLVAVPGENALVGDVATYGNTVLSVDFSIGSDELFSSFSVPSDTRLTVNSGVKVDLSALAVEHIDFSGTVINNGTILLPADFTLENAPQGGTFTIGEKSYTWDEETGKWLCLEGGHSTEKDENKATCQRGNICDTCGKEYGEADPDAHSINSDDGKCSDCQNFIAVVSVTIGDTTTYYETLNEAVTMVQTGTEDAPATLKLEQDIDLGDSTSQTIEFGVYTIDLDGHKLSSSYEYAFVLNIFDGDVTIIDSSESKNGEISGYNGVYFARSTARINDALITAENCAMSIFAQSTITITGATIAGAVSDMDIINSTIILDPGEDGIGASFPGGLSMSDRKDTLTLKDILGEGTAY